MNQTLQLAAIFSSHMVLSRGKNIRIFGEAAQGAVIAVTLAGQRVETMARGGQFEAVFAPMEAGGPYTLTAADGNTTLTLNDVMIGDVYLAGGQSNMEWPLAQAQGGPELIKTLDQPMIRYVNFPCIAWPDEAGRARERQMRWKPLKPNACSDISAVACHFALHLQPQTGVAVGIIGCFLGGSSVTCWLDEAALCLTAAGTTLLETYRANNAWKSDAQFAAETKAFEAEHQAWWKQARELQCKNPGITWEEIRQRAGNGPWPPPEGMKSPYRPAGLADTMVKRIAPCALTGILYYQGETDARHPQLYRPLLMTLIAVWRDWFMDPTLPFLFVQLPMFIAKGEADDRSWPLIRQAQERVCRDMRGTGMAVLIDGGEFDNIHPVDKQTVGYRLYLQALNVVYRQAAQADGPYALAARPGGKAMVIALSLPVRFTGEAALFELAGADGVYHPAQARAEGNELILTADGVDQPMAARYAWVNYGVVNAFGETGLPLAPFQFSAEA